MLQTLMPLAIFAFVSTITPGPNNIMLTSSGIVHGFVRTIPHMLGIVIGLGILLALCALGIGSLVLVMEHIQLVLKVLGSGYLLYLAWQLRSITIVQDQNKATKPMSFYGAALFQFANPKAWVMSVSGASAFLPLVQPMWLAVTVFCLVFCAVCLPCIGVWVGAGSILRRFLMQEKWQRLFSLSMMLLTIYTAIAMWR